MIRTSLGLIIVFALIAAACVAFGAYFSFVTLETAHRKAVEARFGVTAERIAASAQTAASLGIALPAQAALTDLLAREARIDPDVRSIDVADRRGQVLFSSEAARVARIEPRVPEHSVSRPVENDLADAIGQVVVRYDARTLAEGERDLAAALWKIAMPTLVAAAVATIAIGLLLAAGLERAARRAAQTAKWPVAARTALADAHAAHAALAEPSHEEGVRR